MDIVPVQTKYMLCQNPGSSKAGSDPTQEPPTPVTPPPAPSFRALI